MPDCSVGCLKDPDATVPCDDCPNDADDVREWHKDISNPLYQVAASWTRDHDLGLTRFWDVDLSYAAIEAIRYVSYERGRLEAELREWENSDRE